ncbi:hypothetical protein LOK49_LG11G01617 [Camellia lanceoleosa]|uniref:Uncharacterized protein n=1 Tax=Camellia lanceoleosa TaxID=1840588 RepID=A0ACC0FYS3_9ERIC|nr:hypothetical protein LOK49_LG11G01617 [Camellia lanceoleosa]
MAMGFSEYKSRAEICEFRALKNVAKLRWNTNNELNGAWWDHACRVEWATCVVGARQPKLEAKLQHREADGTMVTVWISNSLGYEVCSSQS